MTAMFSQQKISKQSELSKVSCVS